MLSCKRVKSLKMFSILLYCEEIMLVPLQSARTLCAKKSVAEAGSSGICTS